MAKPNPRALHPTTVRSLLIVTLLGALGISGLLVVALLAPGRIPGCSLREWMGVPCLTCGTTTAWTLLVEGHLRAGVLANPLAAIGGVGLLGAGVASTIALIRGRIPTVVMPGRRWWWVVGLLGLANWLWVALRFAN